MAREEQQERWLGKGRGAGGRRGGEGKNDYLTGRVQFGKATRSKMSGFLPKHASIFRRIIDFMQSSTARTLWTSRNARNLPDGSE